MILATTMSERGVWGTSPTTRARLFTRVLETSGYLADCRAEDGELGTYRWTGGDERDFKLYDELRTGRRLAKLPSIVGVTGERGTVLAQVVQDESPAVRLAGLVAALRDFNERWERRGKRASAEPNELSVAALRAVFACSNDEVQSVSFAARTLLIYVRGAPDHCFPSLPELVSCPDRGCWLLTAFQNEDEDVCAAAKYILRSAFLESRPESWLSEFLDHDDPTVRHSAETLLAEEKAPG